MNVCHWFAERADLILLLFDAHKLDISDEFKAVIERLKGQDDKIRVILNKADQVSPVLCVPEVRCSRSGTIKSKKQGYCSNTVLASVLFLI